MNEPDEPTLWWRCALSAYLDSWMALDHADEDEARERAVGELRDTVISFVEGDLNFGTLKYRMDNASSQSGHVFPPRSVSSTLSDLALGVPIDDLEPALRRAARPPEGPGEAKGTLMDLEEFLEREVARGHLKRSQARAERWPELLACLWYIQEPQAWPLADRTAMRYLQERGEIYPLEPAHDYAEYAGFLGRLAGMTGADLPSLEHLLSALSTGELEVPTAEGCFRNNLSRAKELEVEGAVEGALDHYERALSIRPRTPEALRRKAALYEGKGLVMAAIGELETLIEIEPLNLEDHRKLLALFKGQRMIREYNIEVRRFKALWDGR